MSAVTPSPPAIVAAALTRHEAANKDLQAALHTPYEPVARAAFFENADCGTMTALAAAHAVTEPIVTPDDLAHLVNAFHEQQFVVLPDFAEARGYSHMLFLALGQAWGITTIFPTTDICPTTTNDDLTNSWAATASSQCKPHPFSARWRTYSRSTMGGAWEGTCSRVRIRERGSLGASPAEDPSTATVPELGFRILSVLREEALPAPRSSLRLLPRFTPALGTRFTVRARREAAPARLGGERVTGGRGNDEDEDGLARNESWVGLARNQSPSLMIIGPTSRALVYARVWRAALPRISVLQSAESRSKDPRMRLAWRWGEAASGIRVIEKCDDGRSCKTKVQSCGSKVSSRSWKIALALPTKRRQRYARSKRRPAAPCPGGSSRRCEDGGTNGILSAMCWLPAKRQQRESTPVIYALGQSGEPRQRARERKNRIREVIRPQAAGGLDLVISRYAFLCRGYLFLRRNVEAAKRTGELEYDTGWGLADPRDEGYVRAERNIGARKERQGSRALETGASASVNFLIKKPSNGGKKQMAVHDSTKRGKSSPEAKSPPHRHPSNHNDVGFGIESKYFMLFATHSSRFYGPFLCQYHTVRTGVDAEGLNKYAELANQTGGHTDFEEIGNLRSRTSSGHGHSQLFLMCAKIALIQNKISRAFRTSMMPSILNLRSKWYSSMHQHKTNQETVEKRSELSELLEICGKAISLDSEPWIIFKFSRAIESKQRRPEPEKINLQTKLPHHPDVRAELGKTAILRLCSL
ncbi:hypothetical protein C8R45DRAFT_922946 [Mycena sanguinolenta]|nr:hypothetical protein C8R45DRAFT_922946 [Mycena sanguinolenta]